ncbi:MAG: DUF3365 domain-containing protein [Verrucomicrobiota bacterium]
MRLNFLVAMTTLALQFGAIGSPSESAEVETDDSDVSQSISEARGRARLLHEAIHGALQITHRDYFEKGDHAPSKSLEEVFAVIFEQRGVKMSWLGVNARVMHEDHRADDRFEKDAVKAISGGAEEYDAVEDGVFRFVGMIQLHEDCLKCHSPNRMALDCKAAGLQIKIPLGGLASIVPPEDG